jgi:hypothetical protein
MLNDVAFVSNFHFNLLLVSQLLEVYFDVCFKKGLSRVLDTKEILFVRLFHSDKIFKLIFPLF